MYAQFEMNAGPRLSTQNDKSKCWMSIAHRIHAIITQFQSTHNYLLFNRFTQSKRQKKKNFRIQTDQFSLLFWNYFFAIFHFIQFFLQFSFHSISFWFVGLLVWINGIEIFIFDLIFSFFFCSIGTAGKLYTD